MYQDLLTNLVRLSKYLEVHGQLVVAASGVDSNMNTYKCMYMYIYISLCMTSNGSGFGFA